MERERKCCAPPRRSGTAAESAAPNLRSPGRRLPENIRRIPGGRALLGARREGIPDDGESPLREVKMDSFLIAAATVTNDQFREFVRETGYETEAERFGWSFVFWSDAPERVRSVRGAPGAEWWRRVDGANWRDVNGPGSEAEACHPDHPVVHVSWNDAKAYAIWAGGRLPTEAEWEHAARGGLGDVKFPWGDREPDETDFLPCNVWQGRFPERNTAADGYAATAPAESFEPNGYGLRNMVGNVWEWTAEPFRIKSLKKRVRLRLAGMKGFKLLKGGSFLCHRSYCHRYRIAARTGTSPDSSTTHQGFRVVWDD